MAANKTIVLITGANQGIGFETAKVISSLLNYHIIIGSRSLPAGSVAVSTLESTKHSTSSLSTTQLDVTSSSSIASAMSQIEQDFGQLDVLINNAGNISRNANFAEQIREQFEVNTFGAAAVTHTFLPLLKKSQNARLVYVSSGLGSLGWRADPTAPYYGIPATTYRMSKAALNMLMLCQHVELKDQGVKVWAFDPGYVVTNLSGTGEEGRQERIRNGAIDASLSVVGLRDIVEGKRDADVGRHINAQEVEPW